MAGSRGMLAPPSEKLTCRGRFNQQKKIKAMGDRSPKSTHKKASQKEAKASQETQRKNAAVASKQAAGKKN
jgi:hypothetical protein